MHVPLSLPDFAVDWQRVREAITPRMRMIIINSPHNPSGAVLQADDLEALATVVCDTDVYFQLLDYAAIDDRNDVDFSQWLLREVGVAAVFCQER